jgi:S-adenosylmethionine:tRNA ribosyltransferase-isomerase
MSDQISDYTFDLPDELIAREPPTHREAARLLVVIRSTGELIDSHISELPRWLRPRDLLVLNNTKVVPARLIGHRTATGAHWEGLFIRETSPGIWSILGKTRGKLQPGETISLTPADVANPAHVPLQLELLAKDDEGGWTARPISPQTDRSAFDWLAEFGRVPLPPYMDREPVAADRDRYQTVYAQVAGSVAAPTAGLHFTPELLSRCEALGVGNAFVTLHVGIGTFRPVSVDRLDQHVMHHEWCELPESTAAQLAATRAAGGRIIAIGTTSVRTLETAALAATGDHSVARLPGQPYRGETNLFIRPPYQFRSVDSLLTNFHLPKSTLLVLVSSFASRDLILRAYHHAVHNRYRFFSYGDAMLLV